ncbi:hypothetical protein R2F61_00630 [Mollicutes bacterium LVI A0078]|nr:hypothetical protein RZE84_00635 [Mollicutes bacterium LVI A0075]WOO91086.1 hypothetical protein R2F61_00630 [Mollicutes bacterium LVI A0078]
MEKGFLLLVGNYYDLVHYILIDGIYYTLSRDNVEKIEDIDNQVQFYIKKVTLTQLEEERSEDPYFLNEPKLAEEDIKRIATGNEYSKVTININRNNQDLIDFQDLSIREDFAYFKDLKTEPVVLLEYKEQ